ncbi:hypothetical protein [Aminobacter sp. LjRoot7]|uniref:hypothetical protein n=1 Tax=Aminobacter sp. LjRoot7 TaxID=3342335 RepID=UPI003ECCE325
MASPVPIEHRRGTIIWGLGLTQIIGYGTLYYSFSILAPEMAKDLDWTQEWVFGRSRRTKFLPDPASRDVPDRAFS